MPLPGSHILRRTVALVRKAAQNLTGIYSQSSWMSWWPIRESFPGAWQRNITLDSETSLLAFSAVFSCVTGIAADVAKMRIKLDRNVSGIWEEITENQPWLKVLRKPNHYQNRIKFVEQWIISKLLYGNSYVLKERDQRGIVNAMYVLDPRKVVPLVADNGDVYYRLSADYLSGVTDTVEVPASEIIHDMMVSLWHPLVGVSPIYACAMSATMGNRIQSQSTGLFTNGGKPGGIIYVPTSISDEQAQKLKATWEANYGGINSGRTAVLGDGLKFEAQTMNSVDSQLIEQLRWTVEDVGRVFHYPAWKLGGPVPPYSAGPQAITTQYYCDCLHPLIESLELCLDDGLALPLDMGTELDLDNLLRMDTSALFDSNAKAVGGGWMKPNEARFRANLAPVTGGDTPYMQQQLWSLQQLSERTAPPDAAAAIVPAGPPQLALPPSPEQPALPPAKDYDYLKYRFAIKLREKLIPA